MPEVPMGVCLPEEKVLPRVWYVAIDRVGQPHRCRAEELLDVAAHPGEVGRNFYLRI